MARKPPSTPQPKARTELLVSRDSARARILERIPLGEAIRELLGGTEGWGSLPDADKWTSYNVELLHSLFSTEQHSHGYAWCSPQARTMVVGELTMHQRLRRAHGRLGSELQYLESVIEKLGLYPEPSSPAALSGAPARAMTANLSQVFVVHGHDPGALQAVARFLERLGIEPVILHEQANRGATLIEKLERHADVPFAVVLLTPDDVGALNEPDQALQPRARQNVVLELGYFVGRLGRERVCALHDNQIELPSDWDGVAWVELDERGGWKLELARELKAAGFAIDMNLAV